MTTETPVLYITREFLKTEPITLEIYYNKEKERIEIKLRGYDE